MMAVATGSAPRPRFVVCMHDATPAYARETQAIIRDLAPLVGRRLSFGVVPNWHGAWPLTAHPDYCRLIQDASEQLLLHGYFHHRERGWGPTSWLTGGSDEMNGLAADETRRIVAQGQRLFTDLFGQPARGFVAPAWQCRHVRPEDAQASGLEHVLGFFALESRTGARVPLATSAWDCGRWGWLGHVGHGIGWLLQSIGRRVPVLTIHPRDLQRGFWPTILRRTQILVEAGYEPSTPEQVIASW